MILATHALIGAAIGKNIDNPLIIITLSLVLHFTMDSFRHGEYFDSRTASIKTAWWKVALDLASGLFIIFLAIYLQKPSIIQTRNILLGAFTSMFPDLLTVLYWKFHSKFLEKIKKFHAFCHRYDRFPQYGKERQWTLRNVVNDLLFSIIAIILLFI
jgi:hypothetical protein